MKKLATIVVLIFLLAGCSSEEKIIDELKSEVEGKYNIVVFDDGMTSGELQQKINNDLLDANKLWVKINSLKYVIMNEDSKSNSKYGKALSLNDYPSYFVFDDKGIVLRTNKLEELEDFMLDSNIK